jgi:hypothetical protein
MCFTLALAYALALASVINYDRKWRYQFWALLTYDTSSVNYDHMFIIQATGDEGKKSWTKHYFDQR